MYATYWRGDLTLVMDYDICQALYILKLKYWLIQFWINNDIGQVLNLAKTNVQSSVWGAIFFHNVSGDDLNYIAQI